MAQDYNIYIHNSSSGSVFKSSDQKEGEGEDSAFSKFKNVYGGIKSFVRSGGNVVNPALQSVAKAIPWVAIVVEGLKTIDRCISAVGDFQENYEGNLTFSMGYQNFKTGLSWATSPISNLKAVFFQQAEYRKQTQENARKATLIGSSTLKNTIAGL